MRKLSAKDIAHDIRSYVSKADLMQKYNVGEAELRVICNKLVENGILTRPEIAEFLGLPEATERKEIFRCPSCNMPQFCKFDTCPQCGVIVSKIKGKDEEKARVAESGLRRVKTPVDATFPESAVSEGEIDTSQWMQYKKEEPVVQESQPNFPPKKGYIKISAQISMDLFDRLNAVNKDISDIVTEALEKHLLDIEKDEI